MAVHKLNDNKIATELTKLKGWSLKSGKLHRTFTCRDFVQAFSRMTAVALAAESMNHHPEWSNVWNKVTVDLSTHTIGGLSNLDFELAGKIQKIFRN
jgi:4a-hydroxytetrahydrobiopterin dehydratase